MHPASPCSPDNRGKPSIEPLRLPALHQSGLLDSPPERAFDRLTELACRLLTVPIALISLVDVEVAVDCQFLKSSQGLPTSWAMQRQMPHTVLCCQQVTLAKEPLVIDDVPRHPVFCHTLALPGFTLAAYLAVPLLAPDGQALGIFCVLDAQPRAWTPADTHTLQELSAVVVDEIALRVLSHERAAATLALQASEEQVRLALEGGQLGTWSRDFATHQVTYDERARAILGLPDESVYSVDDFFAAVYPADRMAIHQERTHAVQTHGPYAIEFRIQHKDGEMRWIQARGRPFYRATGQPWRLAGVLLDITEQKRATARLTIEHAVAQILAEKDTLAAAAQLLLAAVCAPLQLEMGELWIPDVSGAALQRMAHYIAPAMPPITTLDMEDDQLCHTPDPDLPARAWQQQAPVWMAAAAPTQIQGDTATALDIACGFAFPLLHGEHCFGVMSFFTSQRLQQDQLLLEMMTTVGRIIGQFVLRTHVETKLREQEAQLQVALIAAQIGTWEVDLHNQHVTRSTSMDILFGYPPDNAPRTVAAYLARLHPADARQATLALQHTIETDAEYRVEYRILLPDGGLRWVIARGELVRDERGRAMKLQGALIDITRRKAAEAELQRSEQHLRDVIDSLFAFVGVMTPDGTLIEANRTALKAANLHPADVLGKPFEQTYWWAYSAEVQANLRAAIARAAAGQTVRYDVTIRLAENQYVIIDFMLSPIRDEAGVVTYLVPSAIDITERKLVEQALRVSEERFRSTFEQAAVGIAHVALDGAWLRVNHRLCDIVGYRQDELLQTTFQQLTHPADLPADLAHLPRLLAGEITGYQVEKRYFQRNGELVWVNLTVSLVRTQEGEPDYFIAVIEDISDRKAAEAALRTGEERFRAVQQATPDGFMIFDSIRNGEGVITDFRWVYTNPAGERLVRRSHAELVGKQLLVEMPGNRLAGLFDAYVQVVESDQVWQREFAYSHEGFDHWFRSTAAKADDGFAVAFTDITAHKQAEAALRRSEIELRRLNETLEIRVAERTHELQARNRELDQFAYVASHDLKAPLRAIDNLAGWLLEDVYHLLPAPSQEHLQKLRGRVMRMEKLLDDLLAYSRAGRLREKPEMVDIGGLVRSITDLILPPGFVVSLREPMPVVATERVPLETILRNLIGNALKHHDHPQEGRLELAVCESPTTLDFTITDNGPGIDPQFHERIFAMFQTLKPRDQVEGSGMGLAIVKKIVESRGGSMIVESTEGTGATFRFSWPKSSL